MAVVSNNYKLLFPTYQVSLDVKLVEELYSKEVVEGLTF